jgi:NADH-quinone oxidoreductase subunit L
MFARSLFREIRKDLPDPATYTGVVKILWNKYFVDEIYDKIIVRPLKTLSTNVFLNISDKRIIDGAANGSASGWRKVSDLFSLLQTGNIQVYGFYMIFGVALAIFVALYIF